MKKKSGVYKVRMTKQTITALVIEGLGDSQKDGEYTIDTVFVINRKTYKQVPESWSK